MILVSSCSVFYYRGRGVGSLNQELRMVEGKVFSFPIRGVRMS